MISISSKRIASLAAILPSLLAVTLLSHPVVAAAQAPASDVVKSVAPSGLVTLARHTPLQVLNGMATRVDHYSPENKLRLVLSIKPPHLAEEEALIREQQTKGSPNFHLFLTPEEWNARFAPSEADEQKVVDWAESVGLTVTKRYNHRLIVDVEGPAGTIEKAFGVTINHYMLHDETMFSNDRDPVIPAHLAGLVYNVQGLNSIQREHGSSPNSLKYYGPDYAPGPVVAKGDEAKQDGDPTRLPLNMSPEERPAPEITGGFMDPSDLFSSQVYNYNGLKPFSQCCNPHNDSGGTPNVSNIAIAGFGNFLISDINGFQATYPYLAENVSGFYIDGTPGCLNGSQVPPCATGETTEDLEYTLATSNSFGSSNNTAHIIYYLGGNGNLGTYTDIYSDMLSDNTARVMSTSWSCTEVYDCSDSTMDSRHSIFDSMVGQGWTLIAASGDRGASDDCQNNIPSSGPKIDPSAHTSVAYPASDYDVVAAGGTQIMLYSDGTWDYEHAWQGGFGAGSCNGNGGGSGGGVSTHYGQQNYQNKLSSFGSKRLTPDISLNALGIGQNLYINGGLNGSANGTSVVAPELAGFFAQENSYLNIIGHICGSAGTASCTPVGNPLWEIYDDALSGMQHDEFYNQLSGCSDNDATQADGLNYFCAGPGYSYDSGTGAQYNLVSGWGSVNMMQLAWGINWQLIPAYSSPSLNFTGPATGKWYNTDQIVSWNLSDAGSSGLPASGVAGFTQGWDSIPADSYSKPHGGTGDSFYSGPEYPYASNGCLSFNGAGGCNGGSGQGCHTALVRGWDNQGVTTYGTYGPICFDSVVPTLGYAASPTTSYTQWVNQSVKVTLTAADAGGSNASGIYKTYYAINTELCNPPNNLAACSVYSGPITFSDQQQSYIYYFTEDNAGNFNTWAYQYISIDTTAPLTVANLGGTVYSGSIYSTPVQVALSPGDNLSGVANTYFQLDSGPLGTYSGSAFTVSTLGSHTVKYWSVDNAGNTETTHSISFTIHSATTAGLTATPNPSALGQKVTMTATVAATISGTPTGSVIFYNGATNLGAATLNGSGVATLTTGALPAGALTLQVSYAGAGNYLPTNSSPYDQTVSGAAQLTSPVQAATLTGTTEGFTWNAPAGATNYQLWLGSTGVNSNNIYSSGITTSTIATPANLPLNGETVYGRLYTEVNGIWLHQDYTFTAAAPAVLTAPTTGGLLTGPTTTFVWSTPAGVGAYQLWLGTTGVASNNLFSSGLTHSNYTTRTNMPTNGETVYARLYTDYNGTWVHKDYTYTAVTTSAPVSPAAGETLNGPSETFTWTAAPGSSAYQFWLGTTGVASNNLYSSGVLHVTTVTRTNMPTNGETIYARIYTDFNGTWAHQDYLLTAAAAAAITSPAPSSTLTGASQTFTWSGGSGGVTQYKLWLGTTGVGSNNLDSTAAVTTTSVTYSNMPTHGETIYARLYTNFGGTWVHTDYTFFAELAATAPPREPVE